jgi:hypothetical protein
MNDMRLHHVVSYFRQPECNGNEDGHFTPAVDAARLPREQQILAMQNFLSREKLSPPLKRMLRALYRPNRSRSESSLYEGLKHILALYLQNRRHPVPRPGPRRGEIQSIAAG